MATIQRDPITITETIITKEEKKEEIIGREQYASIFWREGVIFKINAGIAMINMSWRWKQKRRKTNWLFYRGACRKSNTRSRYKTTETRIDNKKED